MSPRARARAADIAVAAAFAAAAADALRARRRAERLTPVLPRLVRRARALRDRDRLVLGAPDRGHLPTAVRRDVGRQRRRHAALAAGGRGGGVLRRAVRVHGHPRAPDLAAPPPAPLRGRVTGAAGRGKTPRSERDRQAGSARHPRRRRHRRARARPLAAQAARGAALLRVHPRGGDAADGGEPQAVRHAPRGRDRAALPRAARPDRRLSLGGRAAGDRPDRRRARRSAEPVRPRRRGRGLDRDQARHPRRDSDAPRGPALRREPRRPGPRGDADRVRGRARDLLRARERGLLDLRARPGRGPDLLAPAAAAPEEGPRHVGADRREAGRVHPRHGAADRARRRGAVARRSGRSGSRTGCSSAPSPASSS